MKRIAIFASVFMVVILAFGTVKGENKTAKEKQLYTAYNIWKLPGRHMKCVNYKKGDELIAVGTQVKDIKTMGFGKSKSILFTLVQGSHKIKINFENKWHPGKTIHDYRKIMFTTKNFAKLTEGMICLFIFFRG